MMAAVKGEPPDEIEDVPQFVNASLLKALSKNPKDRFPVCTAFVDALGGLESASPLPNPADKAGWRSPDRQQRPSGVSEADVLRKKLALSRAVKAIPAEDRSDAEFGKIAARAEDELAVAEEACKFGRFAAAAESLAAAQSALDELSSSKTARRAREEAERKAREGAARKAREEAERKAREEAARKAREGAARKAWEEAERKAREEAARKAREEAWEKAARKRKLRKVLAFLIPVASIAFILLAMDNREHHRVLNKPVENFPNQPHSPGERKTVQIGSQTVALRWCPAGPSRWGRRQPKMDVTTTKTSTA